MIEMDVGRLDLLPGDAGASVFSGIVIDCPNSVLGPTVAAATGANCLTTWTGSFRCTNEP
jgi:hypothetical protein